MKIYIFRFIIEFAFYSVIIEIYSKNLLNNNRKIKIKCENINLMSDWSYLSDLSSNDLILIKQSKINLRWTNLEERIGSYTSYVFVIRTFEWNTCFQIWFIRIWNCIRLQNWHFEKSKAIGWINFVMYYFLSD